MAMSVLGSRPPVALGSVAACLALTFGAAASGGGAQASAALGMDSQGRLAFKLRALTGLRMEASAGHKELYPMEVGMDIETINPANGVTVSFNKQSHGMTLGTGLQTVNGLAWGRFNDNIETTGWSELYVDTSDDPLLSNDVTMYAAGFIEGVLTCVRIASHYANLFELMMKRNAASPSIGAIKDLIKNQVAFLQFKSNLVPHALAEEPEDPYWKHMRYSLFQLWGLVDGYNIAAKRFGRRYLSLEDVLVINSAGELPQLFDAYSPQVAARRKPLWFLQRRAKRRSTSTSRGTEDPLDDAHWERRVADDGRCSALVRVASGFADLLVGHTTWDDYSKMTRIYKYYKFPLGGGSDTVAKTISFSSYPGTISSTDDFYTMSSGLVVMETSLEILNSDVWNKLPEFPLNPRLPSFLHVMATNRLAKSAEHWAKIFTSYNPGAYCAQWMAVDYNNFKYLESVTNGTLWVTESLPGVVHSEDVSWYLREHGYWPSYNRPFFQEIRERSGHAEAQKSHGSLYSWDANPRATIFAEVAKDTNTLMQMRELMTRNNAAAQSSAPGHQISARMDLSAVAGLPNGGIDAKVTNRCLMQQLAVQAVSGPAHGAQLPFQWKDTRGQDVWPAWPHYGLPNYWNFPFVQMTPAAVGNLADPGSC